MTVWGAVKRWRTRSAAVAIDCGTIAMCGFAMGGLLVATHEDKMTVPAALCFVLFLAKLAHESFRDLLRLTS